MAADRVRQAGPDPLDALALEADRDAAQGIAAGLDDIGPAAGNPAADATAPAISNAQAVAGAIAAGREAFCFFTKLESPRRVLTDDRAGQLAALADPVLTKHGIELGRYLGDYGAELALAIGLFSVVSELRAAVAAELASRAAKNPEPVTELDAGQSVAADGDPAA